MKLLIFMRKDLNMSTGKIAAQAAHAAQYMEQYLTEQAQDPHNPHSMLKDTWERNNNKKVCLQVTGKEIAQKTKDGSFIESMPAELLVLKGMAADIGCPIVKVVDAGRTEVAPNTVTCLAMLVRDRDRTFDHYGVWTDDR